jgi:hypothetical protein
MDGTIEKPIASKDGVLLRHAKETKMRSAVKMIGWRILGSAYTGVLVNSLFNVNAYMNHTHLSPKQNMGWAAAGFTIDIVGKAVGQYAYERGWTHVNWGYENGTASNLTIGGILKNGADKVKNYLRLDKTEKPKKLQINLIK